MTNKIRKNLNKINYYFSSSNFLSPWIAEFSFFVLCRLTYLPIVKESTMNHYAFNILLTRELPKLSTCLLTHNQINQSLWPVHTASTHEGFPSRDFLIRDNKRIPMWLVVFCSISQSTYN